MSFIPWKFHFKLPLCLQLVAACNISEEYLAAVQMPMKTVASLIIIVALGTMGYFQMVERLNNIQQD